MTTPKEPRNVWWIKEHRSARNISNRIDLFTAVQEEPQNPGWIHVIEYSAYAAVCTERDIWKGRVDTGQNLYDEERDKIAELTKERDYWKKDWDRLEDSCLAAELTRADNQIQREEILNLKKEIALLQEEKRICLREQNASNEMRNNALKERDEARTAYDDAVEEHDECCVKVESLQSEVGAGTEYIAVMEGRLAKERSLLTEAEKALEVAEKYLDEDIAMLECDSRQRYLPDDMWSQGMFIRDVLSEVLAKIREKKGGA